MEPPIAIGGEAAGSTPGVLTTPMCIQSLTAALQIGKIKIDAPAIVACETPMKAATADCSFAKSFGMPLPAACDGITTGTLPRGEACRSSLECTTGLQCVGVGPSDLGRSTPPAPRGATCGTGVDALATYTRQFSAEKTRPACEGFCRLNRCQDFHALGEECQADLQCGPAAKCRAAKCTKS